MLSTSLSMDVLVRQTMKGAAKCNEIAGFRKGTRTNDESTFSNDTRTHTQIQDTSTHKKKKKKNIHLHKFMCMNSYRA